MVLLKIFFTFGNGLMGYVKPPFLPRVDRPVLFVEEQPTKVHI
jgi:hypothetical protein